MMSRTKAMIDVTRALVSALGPRKDSAPLARFLDNTIAAARATRADLLDGRNRRAAQTDFDPTAEEDVRASDWRIANMDREIARLTAARASITKEA